MLPAVDACDQRFHDRDGDLRVLLQQRGELPCYEEDALGLFGRAHRRAAGVFLDQCQLTEEIAWTHLADGALGVALAALDHDMAAKDDVQG